MSAGIRADNSSDTAHLIVNGEDAISFARSYIKVPVGTTENRPLSPQAGMIRFNSTTSRFEAHNGVGWADIITSSDT